MSRVDPKKLPIFGAYRMNFSGASTPYGTSLSWQAIPDCDVHEGYHVMTNIVSGPEIKTKKRRELLLRFFIFVGHYDPALKRKSQWHSAEHKVNRLLEEKLPLNLENARNITDISPNCGGNNELLSTPEDFQLLEVLELGERIQSQVEKFIETGELPLKASSSRQSRAARMILSFPGNSFFLPLFIRRKLFNIGWRN